MIEADDADSALSLLEDIEIAPDVLLVDYQLGPGKSGLDLYAAIRARLGTLPCAVISADRTPELQDACQTHAIELLPKPLDRHKLGAFLDSVATGSS